MSAKFMSMAILIIVANVCGLLMETFPFLSTKNLQFAQQISHDDFFYI